MFVHWSWEHTEQEQIQIVQDLIARKVDGIAVAPSNAPAMARVLKRAKDAGIPVITWDSDVLAEDKGVANGLCWDQELRYWSQLGKV